MNSRGARHRAGKSSPNGKPGGDGRTGRKARRRTSASSRPSQPKPLRGSRPAEPWRPELVPRAGDRGLDDGAILSDEALGERVERIRRAVYDLYGDLEYFKSSPAEHRDCLRRGLDWPDVGHITSLLRSLAEEGRFADWLRFNRALHGFAFVGTPAREKSA